MLLALLNFAEPVAIRSAVWIDGPRTAQHRRAELKVDLSGDFRNPFDPREASLDALIVLPSGKRVKVPGFLYQGYRRKRGPGSRPIAVSSTQAVADGKAALTERFDQGEVLEAVGKPEWRIRFSPWEKGLHQVELVWRTKAGLTRRKVTALQATPGKGGFVRVSPVDRRYFRLDDGSAFWPIGANLCWGGPRGTYDFDKWIPEFTKQGANWGRLWLSPHWTTFALERPELGIGRYDQGNAWRLDYVLGMAERNGMKLSLCIESYNVLRDRINWPEWERSPINAKLGGPLATPADFWTNVEADRQFLVKLRYLVARYGASSSLMSWEFWNEVDGTTGYQVDPVARWHARTVASLKQLDPYAHLVTTSFGGHGASAGDEKVFGLSQIDFSQTHSYEAPDIPFAVASANRRLGTLRKPHFVGEVGADTTGPRAEDDPTGMQIRDPAWAALAVGDAGAAMAWWWDSYISPRGLASTFRPLREFTKDIAFDRESFRRESLAFGYRPGAKVIRTRRDIQFPVGTPGFSRSAENRPRTIRVTVKGADSLAPLSPLMQGTGNHPELHNPLTLEINLPWPTTVAVSVGDVSGYGGAAISLKLDGKDVARKEFPDPDGDRVTTSLKQFAGDYKVDVPAGKHTVVVSNPGQDWFMASIRVVGAQEATSPPLVGWGLVGKTTALAWVRHADRTWQEVAIRKRVPAAVKSAELRFPGLAKGSWRFELWDTLSGRVMATGKVEGERIALPAISTDLAVKLRRAK